MGSGWRKARKALGLASCMQGPDLDDPSSEGRPSITESGVAEVNISDAADAADRNASAAAPSSAPKSSSRLNLIRTSVRLSKITCAICLESMKPGNGQALFTAECSHTFHFSCIASNVRHGNLKCPVCRAKWKEVPWQAPVDLPSFSEFLNRAPGVAGGRSRRTHHRPTSSSRSPITGEVSQDEDEDHQRQDPHIPISGELGMNARGARVVFDDDEPLSPSAAVVGEERVNSSGNEQTLATDVVIAGNDGRVRDDGTEGSESSLQPGIDVQGMVRQDEGEAATTRDESSLVAATKKSEGIALTCYPEVNAVPAADIRDPFTVLVHLKSSAGGNRRQMGNERGGGMSEQGSGLSFYGDVTSAQILDPTSRAPLDLVTVLDISGSMAGTKLILLKRAMAFVIRNLSQADRLSVVVFSSSARRLFPLKRMVEEGRRHALRCVDSLMSTGGTNIADGLKKGAKMLEDRRMKNPVASIMLLSDGQDTYTIGNRVQFSGSVSGGPRSSTANSSSTDARRLLPGSMRHRRYNEVPVPVHTFGFGADHDAATMHSISEVSGGTFSFIQAEAAVQDAFAQCIGGLLSVVSQSTTLSITTAGSGVQINSIQAGSYETSVSEDRCQGEVKLGDLYAEEERDVLVELRLPAQLSSEREGDSMNASAVLSVSCTFRDPVHTEIHQTVPSDVQISRPQSVDPASQSVNLEVDRQKNRMFIAQRIVEAGHLADNGDIAAAQQILARAKDYVHSSAAFQAGDHLSTGLESELTEIQLRVANRQIYERTGRAYILSAQSSHFRQRATTRGDLGDKSSSRDYQTTSMTDMIARSQTLPGGPHTAPLPSPSRMLLRRISGRVQDSQGQ